MEEWAKIPEDIVELKPMELNNDPKSCEMEISPEIKKFQEGSGFFWSPLICEELVGFLVIYS